MFTFTLFKKTYTVATLADASAAFNAARDKSGKGMRSMPLPAIATPEGGELHFSYNGKIWNQPSSAWAPGVEAVYSPYPAA